MNNWIEEFIRSSPYVKLIRKSLGAMITMSNKAPKGCKQNNYIDPLYEFKIVKCKGGYKLKWRLQK